MRLKIKSVDFVDFVNALLASVKPLADRKSIRLYFQHPSAPCRADHRSGPVREGRPQPPLQRHQVHPRGRPDHGLPGGAARDGRPDRRGHRHRHPGRTCSNRSSTASPRSTARCRGPTKARASACRSSASWWRCTEPWVTPVTMLATSERVRPWRARLSRSSLGG